MKHRVLHLFVSILCAIGLLIVPLTAITEGIADEAPDQETEEATLPAIIITEVQTGGGISGTAGNEFIELYNASGEAIDLTGWQLRYVSATASSASIESPSFAADIIAERVGGQPKKLEPGEHFVLRTNAMTTIGQIYSGNLTANGSLVLFAPADALTCERTAIDALAWKAGLYGDGSPVTTDGKDALLVRFTNTDGAYVHIHDNMHDVGAFSPAVAGMATPGAKNMQTLPHNVPMTTEPTVTSGLAIIEDDCIIPDPITPPANPPPDGSPPSITDPDNSGDENRPAIPAGNIGLKSPQISELLPNPASPKTDANDEFIELYNPNDAPFDLTGYMLEVGTKTKRRYTFPAGTIIQPKTFLAFFSGDTNLALSNTGGQVRFVDPFGNVLVESAEYASAKDNQVWVLAEGKWQWSTAPTPNAINIIRAPESKKKPSSSNKSSVKSASSTKSGAGSGEEEDEAVAATTATPPGPLHPGVLALIAGFAVLYGAYEYRQDLANKIRHFRTNRAARGAASQSVKGR